MYYSLKDLTNKLYFELTAGKAKNEIANTLKPDATILPIHVLGTVSP